MNDLLNFAVEAHGGLKRWSRVEAVTVAASITGEEWRIKSTGALSVPSIGLAISGDCVYNNTHLYLAQCDENARNEWLQALDMIESLHPKAVVAGHSVLDQDSSPRHIEETRRYIHDFNSCLARTAQTLRRRKTHKLLQILRGRKWKISVLIERLLDLS